MAAKTVFRMAASTAGTKAARKALHLVSMAAPTALRRVVLTAEHLVAHSADRSVASKVALKDGHWAAWWVYLKADWRACK